jgi:hypothetical protein
VAASLGKQVERYAPNALGACAVRVLQQDGLDHYAVAMADPEGNEFDVN